MPVNNFFLQAIILLGSGILCVPIAKRMGFGSILGYLIAGVIIGPFVLGFIGSEGEDIMHASEFGVVMMLFLVGLELNPKEFWVMRKSIVGLGLVQLGFTAVLVGMLAHIVFGLSHTTSFAVAVSLGMSSTAIILQTLKEKSLQKSAAGQNAFSVLLFQDLMIIPVLAFLPLLAVNDISVIKIHTSLLQSPTAWMQTLIVLAAVLSVVLIGRYVVEPLMHYIARTRLRELFTASALLLVISVAYIMTLVGISPALGTFLAGVVLANSRFRHELESDVEPFKGLLLGFFFIGVGSTINFRLLAAEPASIAMILFSLMLIKFLVLLLAGKIFKMRFDQNILFGILLSQVGEFAFVIITFSTQLEIISTSNADILMLVTALSMASTPLFLFINEKFIDPYLGTKERGQARKHDIIDEKHAVIIAGFGHFGSTIGRFLRANGINATILDNDSDRVDLLRKMGFEVYYGDATRLDLLRSAGAEKAKMLIAAIDNPIANNALIISARKHFPHLKIMARARNRFDAYELIESGIENIYRETLYTSVHMAVDVLHALGVRRYTATRKAQDFIKYDEEALRKLAASRNNTTEYIINVREQIELEERLLSEDLHQQLIAADKAWGKEK